MRVLVYGDLHLRDVGSFPPFHAIGGRGLTLELENLLLGMDFVAEQVLRTSPDLVAFLGDAFHLTESASVQSIYGAHLGFGAVKRACDSVGALHILLKGNHDSHNELHNINLVDVLCGYGRVFSRPESLQVKGSKVWVQPHTSDLEALEANLRTFEKEGCDLLLTHLDFQGCRYETGRVSESMISPQLPFDCLSGDIHLPQRVGRVVYPGSLVQHRFSRFDLSPGGVVLYEKGEVEFFPNLRSRHYVKIQSGKPFPEGLTPENSVLQVSTSMSREEVEKELPGWEFMIVPEAKGPSLDRHYTGEFSLASPEDLLRSYVTRHKPEAEEEFERIMGKKGSDDVSDLPTP